MQSLAAAGVIKHIDMISTNSGAGWCITPMSYVPVNADNAPSLQDIIGLPTPISSMTVDSLKSTVDPRLSLYNSQGIDFVEKLAENLESEGDRVWPYTLGETMLQRQQVWTDIQSNPIFATEDEAKKYASAWPGTSPMYPRPGFPIHLAVSSVCFPTDDLEPTASLPFDYTAQACGSYRAAGDFHGLQLGNRISTNCFDAESIGFLPGACLATLRDDVKLFSPADIAGVSSMAPAEVMFNELLKGYLPQFNISTDPGAPKACVVDGAFCGANLALVPQVVRGTKHVIAVLSSELPLDTPLDKFDTSITFLFGKTQGSEPINGEFVDLEQPQLKELPFSPIQLFEPEDLEPTIEGLRQSQDIGPALLWAEQGNPRFDGVDAKTCLPAIFTKTYVTKANPSINLAQREVTVTWVYLTPVDLFRTSNMYENPGVEDVIKGIKDFPNIRTVGPTIFPPSGMIESPLQSNSINLLGNMYGEQIARIITGVVGAAE